MEYLFVPKENTELNSTTMSSDNPTKDVHNRSQKMTATSEVSASTSTWKLEESSIWWLSSDWLSNPGNILLLTSVPFFAGAYFGYRMPAGQLEDLIEGSVGGTSSTDGVDSSSQKKALSSGKRTSASVKAIEHDAVRAIAASTASKALRIATLGMVGTFGFVGAMGFYMSGYESLEEAVTGTTRWASSWGKSMEHVMGGDQAVSKMHPEVLATKHMKGDEQLSYIYDKYIKEEVENDKDTLWQDDDDPQKDKDASPTLYTVYEK